MAKLDFGADNNLMSAPSKMRKKNSSLSLGLKWSWPSYLDVEINSRGAKK